MKILYHFLKNYSVREKFYISLKEKLTLSFWKIKFKNFKFHFLRYLNIRKNGTSEFAFYHGLDDGLGFIDSIWYHIHFKVRIWGKSSSYFKQKQAYIIYIN